MLHKCRTGLTETLVDNCEAEITQTDSSGHPGGITRKLQRKRKRSSKPETSSKKQGADKIIPVPNKVTMRRAKPKKLFSKISKVKDHVYKETARKNITYHLIYQSVT